MKTNTSKNKFALHMYSIYFPFFIANTNLLRVSNLLIVQTNLPEHNVFFTELFFEKFLQNMRGGG